MYQSRSKDIRFAGEFVNCTVLYRTVPYRTVLVSFISLRSSTDCMALFRRAAVPRDHHSVRKKLMYLSDPCFSLFEKLGRWRPISALDSPAEWIYLVRLPFFTAYLPEPTWHLYLPRLVPTIHTRTVPRGDRKKHRKHVIVHLHALSFPKSFQKNLKNSERLILLPGTLYFTYFHDRKAPHSSTYLSGHRSSICQNNTYSRSYINTRSEVLFFGWILNTIHFQSRFWIANTLKSAAYWRYSALTLESQLPQPHIFFDYTLFLSKCLLLMMICLWQEQTEPMAMVSSKHFFFPSATA